MQWKYRIVKGLLLYYSTTPQVAKVLEFQDNLKKHESIYIIYEWVLGINCSAASVFFIPIPFNYNTRTMHHHYPLLNRSWILPILTLGQNFGKSILENKEIVFENGVINTKAMGYIWRVYGTSD